MKPCKCESAEFITNPNQYDIYKTIGGELKFIKTEQIDDNVKLYCRECGEEYEW
jgi:hypothetical protein